MNSDKITGFIIEGLKAFKEDFTALVWPSWDHNTDNAPFDRKYALIAQRSSLPIALLLSLTAPSVRTPASLLLSWGLLWLQLGSSTWWAVLPPMLFVWVVLSSVRSPGRAQRLAWLGVITWLLLRHLRHALGPRYVRLMMQLCGARCLSREVQWAGHGASIDMLLTLRLLAFSAWWPRKGSHATSQPGCTTALGSFRHKPSANRSTAASGSTAATPAAGAEQQDVQGLAHALAVGVQLGTYTSLFLTPPSFLLPGDVEAWLGCQGRYRARGRTVEPAEGSPTGLANSSSSSGGGGAATTRLGVWGLPEPAKPARSEMVQEGTAGKNDDMTDAMPQVHVRLCAALMHLCVAASVHVLLSYWQPGYELVDVGEEGWRTRHLMGRVGAWFAGYWMFHLQAQEANSLGESLLALSGIGYSGAPPHARGLHSLLSWPLLSSWSTARNICVTSVVSTHVAHHLPQYWSITYHAFCKHYVYLPLRAARLPRALALILSECFMWLWHGYSRAHAASFFIIASAFAVSTSIQSSERVLFGLVHSEPDSKQALRPPGTVQGQSAVVYWALQITKFVLVQLMTAAASVMFAHNSIWQGFDVWRDTAYLGPLSLIIYLALAATLAWLASRWRLGEPRKAGNVSRAKQE